MKTAAKDFKMTELGPIPKDWEVKRLGDCCAKIGSGATPTGGASVYLQTGVSLIRSQNVYNGYFKYEGLAHISDAAAADLEGVTVCEEDVLLNITGDSVARSTRVPSNVLPARVNQHVAIIRTRREVLDSCFLQCYLTTPSMQAFMLKEASGQGGSRNALTKGMVSDFQISLPPLPEQRKIAAALSDVDEMIAALEKLIEKKRKIKTGAMQRLLTGKTRLPGFKGAWVEKRFDECFEPIGNNTFSREFMCHDTRGIANIHYGDVLVKYGCVLDFSKDQIDSLTLSLLIKSESLKDGDLIIADTAEDETVGKAVEVQHLGARQAVAGLHTIACRPTMEFAPGWLGYYINSSAFHNQLLPLISGTKVSSISKAGLRTTVLTFPILAEQKAIAKVLGDMDEEIAALEAELAKTRQLKQGMMQELLTGKVRLV